MHVVRHSSSMRSACRQTVVLSVLLVLIINDHSAKRVGAIRSASSRYERDELVKSSAGGRVGAIRSASSRYERDELVKSSAGGRVGRRDRSFQVDCFQVDGGQYWTETVTLRRADRCCECVAIA